MDYIIFYKKNESLRESLSKIRLNESAVYTQYFIKDIRQIKEIKEITNEKVLLYYFAENLTEKDKESIQNIAQENPRIKIVLFSDRSYALDAWSLDIMHFDVYPVVSNAIVYAYNKWQKSMFEGNELKELTVKTDEGIHKLMYKDIHYLQAAGNYTTIHYGLSKCLLLSRQIGTFSELYENEPNFKRVHRSLIINFQNVKSCSDQCVTFRNMSKSLSISQLLENKIKRILIQK